MLVTGRTVEEGSAWTTTPPHQRDHSRPRDDGRPPRRSRRVVRDDGRDLRRRGLAMGPRPPTVGPVVAHPRRGRDMGRRAPPRSPRLAAPTGHAAGRGRSRSGGPRRRRVFSARGQGMVVTHHSLAAWPAWDGWADAIGGRFFYAPGRLRSRHWPSSGTRITSYTARVVAPAHPVCAGVDDFGLTDELYCCPIFEEEVVPLLRTDADTDGRLFTSTYEHVLHGEASAPDCRDHPPASDLIGWATAAGRSPIVYLQPGDSGTTFASAPYRRLVGNALAWVASPPAHRWAEATGPPGLVVFLREANRSGAQHRAAADAGRAVDLRVADLRFVRHLPLARVAAQLQAHLVDLAQARRADRLAVGDAARRRC